VLQDIRECPATWSLAASWVLVFALMQLAQAGRPDAAPPGSMAGPLPVSTATSHRFGDMTWAEVRRGEAWRLVTATFVHFGLIHLGMNLVGLIKLGRLIEPWYGPGPFLAACLTIGGLGNLAGGLLRQGVAMAQAWAGGPALAWAWPGLAGRFPAPGPAAEVSIHTGGGSTILLGLIGLAAVVGWRSRTRIGSFLRDQMLVLVGFTALLGVLLHNLIDNYGHAGGALVGAAIGLVHRPMIRVAARPVVRRLSWAAAAALSAACLVAAARDDRAESALKGRFDEASGRYRADFQELLDLERLYVLYGRAVVRAAGRLDPTLELDARAMVDLFDHGPPLGLPPQGGTPDPAQLGRDRAELGQALDRLDASPAAPGDRAGAVAADVDRLRALGRVAMEQPPGFEQAYEFFVCWRSACVAIAADRARAEARLIEVDRVARGAR